MKRDRDDFERLIAELRSDAEDLRVVVDENARAWERIEGGADDPLDWAALGYTIHNTYGLIDELRSFRRLFRNLYARPLDPDRTRLVQSRVGPAVASFTEAHSAFVGKLGEIAAALEDSE